MKSIIFTTNIQFIGGITLKNFINKGYEYIQSQENLAEALIKNEKAKNSFKEASYETILNNPSQRENIIKLMEKTKCNKGTIEQAKKIHNELNNNKLSSFSDDELIKYSIDFVMYNDAIFNKRKPKTKLNDFNEYIYGVNKYE